MVQLPDHLAGLYWMHRERMRWSREEGGGAFTDEEAFWLDFAQFCFYTWDDGAEQEIKLSEVFGLYLSLYSNEIRGIPDGPEAEAFLYLLAGKYLEIPAALMQNHFGDEARQALELARAVFRGTPADDMAIVKLTLAASVILSVTIAVADHMPLPLRLVDDVNVEGYPEHPSMADMGQSESAEPTTSVRSPNGSLGPRPLARRWWEVPAAPASPAPRPKAPKKRWWQFWK